MIPTAEEGTASMLFVPGNCEGGWGYNDEYTDLFGRLTTFAKTNAFTDAELIKQPVFRRLDNAAFHGVTISGVEATEFNKVLGDAIPATSFAAGANAVGAFGTSRNYNFHTAMTEGWPRKTDKEEKVWCHSDIKNVSYFFLHGLFRKIVELK